MPSRNQQQFLQLLRNQLEILQDAATLYDHGRPVQALPMAVALRVLFHTTTRSSTSLLKHLRAEDVLLPRIGGFDLTVEELKLRGVVPRLGMTMVASFTLNLTSRPTPVGGPGISFSRSGLVSYPRWWHQEVAFSDGPSVVMSRRELVLLTANKDGGAHVDAEVPSELETLQSGIGTYTIRERDGRERRTVLSNAHWRAIRIIAQEVLTSEAIALMADRTPWPAEYAEAKRARTTAAPQQHRLVHHSAEASSQDGPEKED